MSKLLPWLKGHLTQICLALILVGVGGQVMTAHCHSDGQRLGFGQFGPPINVQGTAPTTSFAGVVDPTNPAWAGSGLAGGMVACMSSCSSLTARNGGALKAAVDYAANSTTPRVVVIPPGEYPMPCGVDLGGDSNVTVQGWNVTFRLTGTCATDAMIRLKNGAHIKIEGVTFSMRDASGTNGNTLAVKVGDGGSTSISDVQFIDTQWIEGVGGDYLRLDGGTSSATVTMVLVERSRFEDGARSGVDVRPGVQKLQVLYNSFRNNADRDVNFEDTGDGPVGQSIVQGNFMERSTSGTAVAVTLSGHGGTNYQDQSVFSYNHIKLIPGNTTGGGTVEATGVSNLRIEDNVILTNLAGSSSPSISVTGKADNVSIVRNFVQRGSTASNATVIKLADDGANLPTNGVVKANRIQQYSGAGVGVDVSGCVRCTVDENNISYYNSTADSGATGFAGLYCASGVGPCSGTWSRNLVTQESGAGRALAGIEFIKNSGSHIGKLTIRDNKFNGVRAAYYSDGDGSTVYNEGYPLISGGQLISAAGEFEGGITTWIPETTTDAETVSAAGALSVSRSCTFSTAAGGSALTLADGVRDGAEKVIKVKSYSGGGNVTLTPTHFADGTTHTISWSAAGGFARLRWDSASTTWRLVGSTGVAIN